MVGAHARPRNPPYTTFYYVRRRSRSEKIFSLQAEICSLWSGNFGRGARPPSQFALYYFLLCSAALPLWENLFITERNFCAGKLWSAGPPALAIRRILLSFMFGGPPALRKCFDYRPKFFSRKALVGAPAVPTRASHGYDNMSALCVAKTMRRQPVAPCTNASDPNFRRLITFGRRVFPTVELLTLFRYHVGSHVRVPNQSKRSSS